MGDPTISVTAQRTHIEVNAFELSAVHIRAWNDDDLSKFPIYELWLDQVIKESYGYNFFTEVEKAIDEVGMIFISANIPTKTYGKGNGYL